MGDKQEGKQSRLGPQLVGPAGLDDPPGVEDHDPFATVVRGSYSNVVGLPLERLEALLRAYPDLTT